jgi:hypothetical protein
VNRDPGLQPERTRLARRRAGLSIAVVAVLTVRLALSHGTTSALVLAAVAVAVGLLVLAAAATRHVTRTSPGPPGRRSMSLLALVAVGYAGLGVLLVLAALG